MQKESGTVSMKKQSGTVLAAVTYDERSNGGAVGQKLNAASKLPYILYK